LEAGGYSVKLTTLYDSNQRQSYIRNEVAKKHVLKVCAGAREDSSWMWSQGRQLWGRVRKS
jgi:hypothetical protein